MFDFIFNQRRTKKKDPSKVGSYKIDVDVDVYVFVSGIVALTPMDRFNLKASFLTVVLRVW